MRFSSCLLIASIASPALAQLGFITSLQDAGGSVVRGALSKTFGFNSTQLDRVMVKKGASIEAHPYALDLTDDNWETVIRTGDYEPFGKTLEDNTTWVISVYGPDQVSDMFNKAFNSVATHNSSEAGGTLPKEMKLARLDYARETTLTTLFWLWKVPILVIGNADLTELRFFKIGQVAPFHNPMAELIANRTLWETMPIWEGRLAPNGSLRPYLIPVSKGWAVYHQYMSRIPTFVLLMISGFLMNIVVGLFHKKEVAPVRPAVLTREEQRAALKARWALEAKEAAALKRKQAEEILATGTSTAVDPVTSETEKRK